MNDEKAAEGPYLNRVEPSPCFDFDVSYVVGPSVKVNAENIGVEHLNAAWHSRDAEVDALKERVKELELQLSQSVPCEWEGAAKVAQEDRDALRKENERLREYLVKIKNSYLGFESPTELAVSALAQPQPQEVKP